MSEPIYCGLAFGSISIDNRGNYRPCCGINPVNWVPPNKRQKLNSAELLRVRQNLMNGVWDPVCSNCQEAEKINAKSMRQIHNEEIKNAPMDSIIDPDNITYLDLSLGSTCNSKCMTCNSYSSNLWAEEEKFIWKSKPLFRAVDIRYSAIEDLISTYKNINKISFIGGEPLVSPSHITILNNLINSGRNKDIALSYITNLTNITDDLLVMWGKFSSVSVSASIDGYDKINDYIRYPFKWQKVESNLRKYATLVNGNKFSMGISCTVSVFNILDVCDLLEFIIKLTTECNLTVPIGVFLNKVTNPPQFDTSLLSVEYRQTGIERLVELREQVPSSLNDLHHALNLLESWMNEPQIENSQLIDKCLTVIDKSDEFRNRSIKDYIPKLYDELQKLKTKI